MTAPIVRGLVRGRMVVLADDAGDIPEGTEVIVLPLSPTLSGKEIIAALDLVPPATAEDGAELERTIAEGWQPMSPESPFDGSENQDAD